MNNRKVGSYGEDLAAKFLILKDFNIIERNYYVHWGELDIIAVNNAKLYFFEVKYSKSAIPAEFMLTKRKRHRVFRSINSYLNKHVKYKNYPVYFGLIAINTIRLHENITLYVESVY